MEKRVCARLLRGCKDNNIEMILLLKCALAILQRLAIYLMKIYLPMLLLLCLSCFAVAQGDFGSAKQQQVIATKHIRQIVSYFYDEKRPGDSTLIESLVFNKAGLCLSQKLIDYTYSNEYDVKGRLKRQITISKNGQDSTVSIFKYDDAGNRIQSQVIKKWLHTQIKYRDDNIHTEDYTIHKFDYGPQKELLREYAVDTKGQVHQVNRYQYVYAGLAPDLEKEVNFYDAKDQLIYLKKYDRNLGVKDYSVDNGKQTFVSESILNANHDLLKFVNHMHLNEEDWQLVATMGHGMIRRETITEVYDYDEDGLCIKKATYNGDKVVSYVKWYFK
jgi:hypothetical protein